LAGLGQHFLQLFIEAGGRFLSPAVFLGLLVRIDPIKTMADELPEILDESVVGVGTIADEEEGTRSEEGFTA